MFDSTLRQFMDEAPVAVAVRATLERLLSHPWIDELFEWEARQQYQSQLLFSRLVQLMGQMIAGTRRSVHEVYRHTQEIGVSITSAYNKLNHLENGIIERRWYLKAPKRWRRFWIISRCPSTTNEGL
jgi:hypothetical protein